MENLSSGINTLWSIVLIKKTKGGLFADGLLTFIRCLMFGPAWEGFTFVNLYADPDVFSLLIPGVKYNSAKSKGFLNISIHELAKNKLFVFQPDKRTLAYVFEDCAEAARFLTPQRCAHLSDSELKLNKNLQHIRRVIIGGILLISIGLYFPLSYLKFYLPKIEVN
jgi:hypothetical protein